MEFFLISLLNGVSYGLMLFMLSAGLTLIFSMMGVLNFAHASFYMLGAYVGYALSDPLGFWVALCMAPLIVGALGAAFERFILRRVHPFGHVAELMMTFGLSFIVLELVQLLWGRSSLDFSAPPSLQGPAFTLVNQAQQGLILVWGAAQPLACSSDAPVLAVACSPFPLSRAFMMAVALFMLAGMWLLLKRSRIGLLIQAAISHPHMVEALGHNLPGIFALVFGIGTGLAALAGVVGGSVFVTEPSMAAAVGAVVFVVVVVGGLGSLAGAFAASLLIGVMQTFAVASDLKLNGLALAQIAPILPYLLLVVVLTVKPEGLFGARRD
jgi:branched-chain amino acid transport system permease protein